MPTHQGQTQTDIVLGDGGSSMTESTSFDFSATYSGLGDLQVEDLASGTDRQNTSYELAIKDATGSTIATLAARYKAWVDRGSATGNKTIDITNNFNPPADGSSPSWPPTAETTALRAWSVKVFDRASDLFGEAQGEWQVRTTVQTGASVIQTIVDQTDSLLRLHLVYLDGAVVINDVVVEMSASVSVQGSLTADPPDVSDRFTP